MELPLMIQMQIDLSAHAHKREIAEGFAKLRAKLPPEPKEDQHRSIMNDLMASLPGGVWLQTALSATPNAMMQSHPLQASNLFWNERQYHGLWQSPFGGLGL